MEVSGERGDPAYFWLCDGLDFLLWREGEGGDGNIKDNMGTSVGGDDGGGGMNVMGMAKKVGRIGWGKGGDERAWKRVSVGEGGVEGLTNVHKIHTYHSRGRVERVLDCCFGECV